MLLILGKLHAGEYDKPEAEDFKTHHLKANKKEKAVAVLKRPAAAAKAAPSKLNLRASQECGRWR